LVDTVTWREVAGATSHYARDLSPPLRTEGTPRAFRSTAAFKEKLDRCFEEMWTVSGLGEADAVVSAGALVKKPGMHGQGAAFDLDAIVWHATDDRPGVDFYAIDFRATPVLYCAVGAVLSRYFVHTLHYLYNASHEDHFHVDTTSAVRFSTRSRARVGFLQATLHYVHGVSLDLDSEWGSATASAVESTLARMGVAGEITTPAIWRKYLLETARIGFGAGVIAAPAGDPDRPAAPLPPGEIDPIEDHERPLEEQRRTPRFYVTRPRIRGPVVERIQGALRGAGDDPGPIDGIYGSLTSGAVVAHQRAHNLQIDGVVGPETAGSLGIELV
jgi:hypothetical protein